MAFSGYNGQRMVFWACASKVLLLERRTGMHICMRRKFKVVVFSKHLCLQAQLLVRTADRVYHMHTADIQQTKASIKVASWSVRHESECITKNKFGRERYQKMQQRSLLKGQCTHGHLMHSIA